MTKHIYPLFFLIITGFCCFILYSPDLPAAGEPQEQCSTCKPDKSSPTGASQSCKINNVRTKMPCSLPDTPSPPPSNVGSDISLTTEKLPVCSTGALDSWNRLTETSLGVSGIDVKGHYIREFPAHSVLWIDWKPQDVYKYTLCGKLYQMGLTEDGKEMDWNNWFVPSPGYEFLVKTASRYDSHDGINDPGSYNMWKYCGDPPVSTPNCIEAEVTPNETFYTNPWFTKDGSRGNSIFENENLTGPELCTYGPWVMDENHGSKPEIHPSELYWWKESFIKPRRTRFWLMQIHDASSRYSAASDFDFSWVPGYGGNPPAGWQPWAVQPRQNMFNIAFEFIPKSQKVLFNVGEARQNGELQAYSGKYVTTYEHNTGLKPDNISRKTHRFKYNGREAVRITELQENDKDITVGYVGLCRNQADTRIQGYLRIGTAVSRHNKPGYHVMFVDQLVTSVNNVNVTYSYRTAAKRKTVTPNPVIKMKRGSLRRQKVAGKYQLVGDIQVKMPGTAKQYDPLIKTRSVTTKSNPKLSIQKIAQNTQLVRGVPLLGNEFMEMTFKSGITKTIRTGGFVLDPNYVSVRQQKSRSNAGAWNNILRETGGTKTGFKSNIVPHHVSQWKITVAPRYYVLKDGEMAKEEDSYWQEKINEAIDKNNKVELAKLFGTKKPFATKWSFQAKNITADTAVPVHVGRRKNNSAIHVMITSGKMPNDNIQVTFPQTKNNDIIHLLVTAEMTDTYGSKGRLGYELWNYVLPVQSAKRVNDILNTLAASNNKPGKNLLAMSRIAGLPPMEPPAYLISEPYRRARMLHLSALRAIQDKYISIDELSDMMLETKKIRIKKTVTPKGLLKR